MLDASCMGVVDSYSAANMSTTVEDLQRRVAAIEDEIRSLKKQVRTVVADRVPMDGSILEWYAEIRRRNRERGTIEERRRQLGIPVDMPRIGAEKAAEMMIAEGVDPDECLVSREIIRLREEKRS